MTTDQVVLGIVFGALLGFGFRHLMKFCERKDLIDRQSYVAQYVSLAVLTIGATTLLGSDELLAAFSCGTAFAWDGFFNKQTEESVFSSVIDLLFNIAAFVFVGAWMPFNDFSNETLTLSVWRLLVIGILVLILRRLPVIVGLYKFIPDIKTFREAVFSGHFGPMGIGTSSGELSRECISTDFCHAYLIRRCLYFHTRRAAASRSGEPSGGSAATARGLDPANRRVHGPLFHRRPRPLDPLLHLRTPRALGFPNLVKARHLRDIRFDTPTLYSPRVDDADPTRAAWRGNYHQSRRPGGEHHARGGLGDPRKAHRRRVAYTREAGARSR